MPRAPQSLQRVLAADPTLAAWQARHAREEALTAVIRGHLPRPLAERVRVADARGPELVLAAGAGAIAAVLKQRGPDLLALLAREGCQFSGIRVRVQVGEARASSSKNQEKQVDREILQPLARLARELPAGPLKTALTRFLRRA